MFVELPAPMECWGERDWEMNWGLAHWRGSPMLAGELAVVEGPGIPGLSPGLVAPRRPVSALSASESVLSMPGRRGCVSPPIPLDA